MAEIEVILNRDDIIDLSSQEEVITKVMCQIEKDTIKEAGEDTFYYCYIKINKMTPIESSIVNDLHYLVDIEFVPKEEQVKEFEYVIQRLLIGI